jgi:hypothetical protein
MSNYQYAITVIIIISMFGWGFALGKGNKQSCPKALPTTVTDMFTVQGDTVYLKQNVDFVISTRGIIVDTAGTIHRKN